MNFTENDHRYFNDDGEVYTSVTTVLKELEEHVDWEAVLIKSAKKKKMSPEDLRKEWDEAGLVARTRGTAYHNKREEELLNTGVVVYDNSVLKVNKPIWEDGVKKSNSMKLLPGVYPELLIWLDSAMIAGQADYIEVTEDNLLNVKDWKTNKKLEFKGFTNWQGKTKKLLYPLSHLDDCNGIIYSLQLNMYAYIILRHNPKLTLGKMHIVHIIFNEDGTVTEVPIEVPNLQKEIKVLMEHFKSLL